MVITEKPLQVINWSGGTSSEWMIFPKNANYQARNFKFRISTATVDQSPISFTVLPNCKRYILLDKGECNLDIQNTSRVLEKTELFFFNGADEVHSKGIYSDFNVIFSSDFNLNVELHIHDFKTFMDISPSIGFLFCLEGSISFENQTYKAPCCIDLTENQHTTRLLVEGRIICGEMV